MIRIADYRRIYKQVGDEICEFEPSDMDVLGAGKVVVGHSYRFNGFESSNGAWIIMETDTTTATSVVAYRYLGGTTHAGYLAAWIARATNTYEYFSEVTIP